MPGNTGSENKKHVIYKCPDYKIYAEETHPLSDKELKRLVRKIDAARKDTILPPLLVSLVITVLLILVYLIFKM